MKTLHHSHVLKYYAETAILSNYLENYVSISPDSFSPVSDSNLITGQ